jgi:hypothetical protein
LLLFLFIQAIHPSILNVISTRDLPSSLPSHHPSPPLPIAMASASASTTASPPPRPQPSPPSTRRILTTEESTQFRRPRPLSSRLSSLPEATNNPLATPPRRSSTFSSDSWGEARRSFHESTDDLLLPRATPTRTEDEPSAWQSAPLAFALLPAVAGLMFQNGGAVVSDVLLLGLAAVFLNWSVRLPWFVVGRRF